MSNSMEQDFSIEAIVERCPTVVKHEASLPRSATQIRNPPSSYVLSLSVLSLHKGICLTQNHVPLSFQTKVFRTFLISLNLATYSATLIRLDFCTPVILDGGRVGAVG